jgi:hypothetical protein
LDDLLIKEISHVIQRREIRGRWGLQGIGERGGKTRERGKNTEGKGIEEDTEREGSAQEASRTTE